MPKQEKLVSLTNYFKKYLPPKQANVLQRNQKTIQMQERGFIEIIYGPMFSGKSSELLRKIRRFEHAKKSCLVVNYEHDNRYTQADEMATHDKITRKALKTSTLMNWVSHAQSYDVVGIDEGQFFSDIVDFCEILANMNKIVVVAALDGTFERKPFGNIINLIPLAEKVSKLNAVCVYCTNEAAFTKRIVKSMEIQLIGGDDMYKPVCRPCFFKEQETMERRVQTVVETEKITKAMESSTFSTPTEIAV